VRWAYGCGRRPRWLTDPDAVFSELVGQAAAELYAAVAPLTSAERRGG
jgi:hypothetical protein